MAQQAEQDPKGIGYNQFYGCRDSSGFPKLDSCFRMTDTLGKLTVCITVNELADIINNYGGGDVDCDQVEYCLDENGILCSLLNGFAVSNYQDGDYIIITRSGSSCKKILASTIPGFGDTCRVVNNANGSYTHFNENNVSKTFGYMINCINDTSFCLTDWDGTVIGDTCIVGTGAGGGGGFDCQDVEDCLTMEGVLCDALNTFGSGTYGTGDKLVGIESNGNCVLYTDIPGVGDTCRVVNNANASYTHTNENGTNVTFGYKLQCINDSMMTVTDWDGTPAGDTCTLRASVDLCGIIQEIQDEDLLMEGDIMFINRGVDCFKVPWGVEGDSCVTLEMEGGILQAHIITDPTPPAGFQKIYCGDQGLYGDEITLNCSQVTRLFQNANGIDTILGISGNTCVKFPYTGDQFDCNKAHALFPGGGLTATDSILAFGSGNDCKSVAVSELNPCFATLPHWDSAGCEEPKIVVQCGNNCAYMTPCDVQNYICGGPIMAPIISKMTAYPTVETQGIKTVKTKEQALRDKSIPIGGLYYIEGGENIKVKNKQL